MIYFIEDDKSIAYVIKKTLENASYQYQWFSESKAFYEALENQKPNLILLDLMLGEENGLDLLMDLKKNPRYSDVPIIIISALSSEMDVVTGLDLGADDYIKKPFGVLELLSRINNKLRHLKENELKYHDLVLKLDKRMALLNEQTLNLTYKEFEIVKILVEKRDQAVSRQVLLNQVWGLDLALETRTIDMHIKSIRQKMSDIGSKTQIISVRSIGYRLTHE